LEVKEYIRIRYEKVKAIQIDQDVEADAGTKHAKIFPKGSFLVEVGNGQRFLMEKDSFNRFYKEVKDA